MKKTLLLVSALFVVILANAQCTPDYAQYDQYSYGVWPDTTANFAAGQVGVLYNQLINFKVPNDASQVDNTIPPGISVDSASVTGVAPLPPGLHYECHTMTSNPCTYMPDSLGCAIITGTPTQSGNYDITIQAVIFAHFGSSPIPYPISYSGYHINVAGASGLQSLNGTAFNLGSNVPNPAINQTTLRFGLPDAGSASIRVYDLVGKTVYQHTIAAKQGENDFPLNTSSFDSGIYIYSVTFKGNTLSSRLIINR